MLFTISDGSIEKKGNAIIFGIQRTVINLCHVLNYLVNFGFRYKLRVAKLHLNTILTTKIS